MLIRSTVRSCPDSVAIIRTLIGMYGTMGRIDTVRILIDSLVGGFATLIEYRLLLRAGTLG